MLFDYILLSGGVPTYSGVEGRSFVRRDAYTVAVAHETFDLNIAEEVTFVVTSGRLQSDIL